MEAARRMAAVATSPARILLFGSHARGEARADSDLDFLVIEQHLVDPYAETVRLRKALRGLGVPVDIVVVSASEATAPRSLAVRDGLREGIVLHEHAA